MSKKRALMKTLTQQKNISEANLTKPSKMGLRGLARRRFDADDIETRKKGRVKSSNIVPIVRPQPIQDVARLMLKPTPLGASELRPYVPSSRVAAKILAPIYQDVPQEQVLAMLLDNASRLLSVASIALGGSNECQIDLRLVFSAALVAGASSIIVAHNHPTGLAIPSDSDIQLTVSLVEFGRMLDIPVDDHIVFGDNCYTSLKSFYSWIFDGDAEETEPGERPPAKQSTQKSPPRRRNTNR